jgi:hypothetical protein
MKGHTMPISNFPNGFAAGVAIQNMPVLNNYGGNVYWVDSGAGSNGNPGTFSQPFSTMDYTVGRCTANNGDMVMVKRLMLLALRLLGWAMVLIVLP